MVVAFEQAASSNTVLFMSSFLSIELYHIFNMVS